MPEEGLEPSPGCPDGILNPARLPIPPLRREFLLLKHLPARSGPGSKEVAQRIARLLAPAMAAWTLSWTQYDSLARSARLGNLSRLRPYRPQTQAQSHGAVGSPRVRRCCCGERSDSPPCVEETSQQVRQAVEGGGVGQRHRQFQPAFVVLLHAFGKTLLDGIGELP